MGLTVNFDFRLPVSITAQEVRARLERWREFAVALNFGAVSTVRAVRPDEIGLTGVVWEVDGDTHMGFDVPVEEGFTFRVRPHSPGAETLCIALCRYPAWIETKRGRKPTALEGAWRYQGFCKTQYASLHGWDAFLRAHRGVIDCVAHGSEHAVAVNINDEGGYWPERNETTLRMRLDEMNGLVAAVAGAFKDAGDDSSQPGKLIAPILEHPEFERLEHSGAERVGDVVERVRKEMDRP
jgi:hypothetical protein